MHWTDVREASVLWKKIVMREVDLTNAYNTPLQEMKDSAGNSITINDLFRKLAKENVVAITDLVGDKFNVNDSTLDLLAKEIKRGDSACVSKYLIVEEWLFDRDLGKMVVHILWLGPYISGIEGTVNYKGRKKDGQIYWVDESKIPCASTPHQPLFAIRYDDLKRELTRYKLDVTGSKKEVAISVFDFFENRQFTSKIICVESKYP